MDAINTVSYKKASLYFDNCDFDSLIEKAESTQTFFINDKKSDGQYYHHLPLKKGCLNIYALKRENWNLPEDLISDLDASFKELEKNWEYAYTICCYDNNGNYRGNSTKERDFSRVKNKLLPPWLAYPLFDKSSMFWKLSGEPYLILFYQYLDTLSEEERAAYCNKFPMPAYFGGERPEIVFYYLKNQTQK